MGVGGSDCADRACTPDAGAAGAGALIWLDGRSVPLLRIYASRRTKWPQLVPVPCMTNSSLCTVAAMAHCGRAARRSTL